MARDVQIATEISLNHFKNNLSAIIKFQEEKEPVAAGKNYSSRYIPIWYIHKL